MRAVVQRVSQAAVTVASRVVGEIEQGFVVLLGVSRDDSEQDAAYLCDKVLNLRVFDDEEGKLNLSLLDVKGDLLVVSQFTLFGDCRKGRRPNFTESASADQAKLLYETFVSLAQSSGLKVATGQFQAAMSVAIHNDGPVTLLLDSKRNF